MTSGPHSVQLGRLNHLKTADKLLFAREGRGAGCWVCSVVKWGLLGDRMHSTYRICSFLPSPCVLCLWLIIEDERFFPSWSAVSLSTGHHCCQSAGELPEYQHCPAAGHHLTGLRECRLSSPCLWVRWLCVADLKGPIVPLLTVPGREGSSGRVTNLGTI